jgi:hypothetical protein
MNDVAYLTIPGDHVEGVTETVLGLYGAHAEALGATALGFLEGSDELVELEHARGALRAIEDTLADLGWPRARGGDCVELVGPRQMLREVIRAALTDAADGVVQAARRYEAASEELPALQRAVEAVPALFALFAGFEGDVSSVSHRGS